MGFRSEPSVRFRLPAVAASVAAARGRVTKLLDERGIDAETGADAVLVVSELTANAVTHGSRPSDEIEVACAVDDRHVTVSVSDCARTRSGPVRLTADAERPSGRGLQIVERVAEWSERIVDGRRVVVARLALATTPTRRERG